MTSVRKVKNSSNDQRGIRCKYLEPSFWVNPSNWYWWHRKEMYSPEARDYLFKIVRKAQHELEKKHKEDFLPK